MPSTVPEQVTDPWRRGNRAVSAQAHLPYHQLVLEHDVKPPGRWDVARSDDAETRAARWEKEANDLSTQVAFLQEELALVRRKLTESPRHVRQLEERLAATQAQLARLTENNERLVATLKEARAQIVTLKEEIDRLAQPPSGYGVFLARHEDGTVDVFTGGRKLRVAVSPALDVAALRRGLEGPRTSRPTIPRVCAYESAPRGW